MKKKHYPIFGDAFNTWLQKNRYNQSTAARLLQVNQSVISRYATGERLPTLTVFLRLINLLPNKDKTIMIKILNDQLTAGKCTKFLEQQ